MSNRDNELFEAAIGTKKYNNFSEDAIINFKKNRIVEPVLKMNPNVTFEDKNWKTINHMRVKKLNELKGIIKEFTRLNIQFLLIKGVALLHYYPKDLPRQSNDFDFMVADIEQYWECHKILLRRGFQFFYNPMFTKRGKNINGVTKYKKVIDKDTEIYIEINIAGFLVSEVFWFNDSDLWISKNFLEYEGVEFYIPNHEMNIVFLILEASGRQNFLIRDAVDFYFLTRKKNINWEYVEEKLKFRYLKNVLYKFKKNNQTALKGDFIFLEKSIKQITREIYHVIPQILKKQSIKDIYLRYLKYLGEKLIEKNKIDFASKLESYMNPKNTFENGIITHFYPLNYEKKSDTVKWLTYENRYYIFICPAGAFLATNLAILNEEDEILIKEFTSNLKIG